MQTAKEKNSIGMTILRVVILVFVIALTALLLIYRDELVKLQGYGYPGIFLLSILANATIIIPMPGVILTSAMGAIFNPWWVALAAGSGATIGELSGYLAGLSGRGLISKNKTSDKVEYWVKRYGGWAIFLMAFIPNPLFDMAGLTAGALKMPVQRFVLFLFLGKVAKMLIFSLLGSTIMEIYHNYSD
ncbi:MAG: VTT domain-containing protein [Anaerolineaceae bacterium]|nr:VTT domain-containing protein [Anaerolineaceae bacterium]MBN2676763.1 VTT domain-containing protein [Anaerolineaceae bacterium]